jgi:hypothetical protein
MIRTLIVFVLVSLTCNVANAQYVSPQQQQNAYNAFLLQQQRQGYQQQLQLQQQQAAAYNAFLLQQQRNVYNQQLQMQQLQLNQQFLQWRYYNYGY